MKEFDKYFTKNEEHNEVMYRLLDEPPSEIIIEDNKPEDIEYEAKERIDNPIYVNDLLKLKRRKKIGGQKRDKVKSKAQKKARKQGRKS
jgi:hypothetical protein